MIKFDLERFKLFPEDEDNGMCVICKKQEDYRLLIDYLKDVQNIAISRTALGALYREAWSPEIEWVVAFFSDDGNVWANTNTGTDLMDCDYAFEDLIFENMKPNYEINITSDELLSFLG